MAEIGWKLLEMAVMTGNGLTFARSGQNSLKWLEMVVTCWKLLANGLNGQKLLEMAGRFRIVGNCRKWLEMAESCWNGWEWLGVGRNGWNELKQLEMFRHGWKWLEMARMARNCWDGWILQEMTGNG